MSEIITGCIAMYLLKETTRNNFNLQRSEEFFKDNYFKIFNKRLPHMDTVDRVIAQLSTEEIEKIKRALVSALVEQHVFRPFRLLDKYYTIAVDGTGVNSYKENNTEQNLTSKKSKNGIVTYYSHVVEAKLVTANKLAISVGSEWVTNESKDSTDTTYNKQDCEQKAFGRLAKNMKADYPRLPVCILADGLYPNKTFMKTCQDNDWAYIVVLKDDSLKLLQEDIKDLETKDRSRLECDSITDNKRTHINCIYEWITAPLTHDVYSVNWLCCTETITHRDKNGKNLSVDTPTRFVNLTSLKVDKDNVKNISESGRMRWKIENEGYNTQKNNGYNLGHKFSRRSFTAYKNYYQCMQIAHIINQLVEKSTVIVELKEKNGRLTIQHLWEQLRAWFTSRLIDITALETNKRIQIRLAAG